GKVAHHFAGRRHNFPALRGPKVPGAADLKALLHPPKNKKQSYPPDHRQPRAVRTLHPAPAPASGIDLPAGPIPEGDGEWDQYRRRQTREVPSPPPRGGQSSSAPVRVADLPTSSTSAATRTWVLVLAHGHQRGWQQLRTPIPHPESSLRSWWSFG